MLLNHVLFLAVSYWEPDYLAAPIESHLVSLTTPAEAVGSMLQLKFMI